MATTVTKECIRDPRDGAGQIRRVHVGELKLLDKVVPCAVTADGVRILSDRGARSLLGHTGKQKASQKPLENHAYHLPSFLASANLKPFIPSGFSMPTISYRHPVNNRVFDGIDATLLADVCWVYIDARSAGALKPHQLPIADACAALARALSKVAIVALIDEACGFQGRRGPDALQQLLNRFLRDEAGKYERTFMREFYEEMFRLNGWARNEENPSFRPGCAARMTNDVIYSRLGLPDLVEVLDDRNPLVDDGDGKRLRLHKHHQFFNHERGRQHLISHLELVTGLMRAFADWHQFIRALDRVRPRPDSRGVQRDIYDIPGINMGE